MLFGPTATRRTAPPFSPISAAVHCRAATVPQLPPAIFPAYRLSLHRGSYMTDTGSKMKRSMGVAFYEPTQSCQGIGSSSAAAQRACFKCGGEGHLARTCTLPSMRCHLCKQLGHYKKDCPQRDLVPQYKEPSCQQSRGHSGRSRQSRQQSPQSQQFCQPRLLQGSQPQKAPDSPFQLVITVYGLSASLLIATGSTNSFIATDFVARLKIKPTKAVHEFNVRTLAGGAFRCYLTVNSVR